MPTAPALAESAAVSPSAGPSVTAPIYAPYAPPVTPTALTRSSATAVFAVSQPTAAETIVRPAEHTLARGKYEAKPALIWVVTGGGLLLALVYTLVRVRQVRRRERDKLAAVMSLRRDGVAKAS